MLVLVKPNFQTATNKQTNPSLSRLFCSWSTIQSMVIQDAWLVWLRLFLFALRLPRKKKERKVRSAAYHTVLTFRVKKYRKRVSNPFKNSWGHKFYAF